MIWGNGVFPGNDQVNWLAMNLTIEMESGRFVKVYLDGKEVLNYASPLRVGPELGQASWQTGFNDPST